MQQLARKRKKSTAIFSFSCDEGVATGKSHSETLPGHYAIALANPFIVSSLLPPGGL